MNWRKSSRCAANECVEVAGDDAVVGTRTPERCGCSWMPDPIVFGTADSEGFEARPYKDYLVVRGLVTDDGPVLFPSGGVTLRPGDTLTITRAGTYWFTIGGQDSGGSSETTLHAGVPCWCRGCGTRNRMLQFQLIDHDRADRH